MRTRAGLCILYQEHEIDKKCNQKSRCFSLLSYKLMGFAESIYRYSELGL